MNARDALAIRTFLERCGNAFRSNRDYLWPDEVLTRAFADNQENTDRSGVLTKVTLLNALYRTSIYDIYGIARHIISIGKSLDEQLARGDHDAIDAIRRGHGIRSKKQNGRRRKEFDFYSFATKYCHWHRPDHYPIYDWYAEVALRAVEKATVGKAVATRSLRQFDRLVNATTIIPRSIKFKTRNFKRLDESLWIAGQILEGDADKAIERAVGPLPKSLI